MERHIAEAKGYEVRDDLDVVTGRTREAPPQHVDGAKVKASVWRQHIMQSPEAKGRDSAVAEILVKHNPETLSADAAKAFLRGLPREQSETQKEFTMTTNTDPKAIRRAEIAASMRDFNRERGHAVKPLAPEHARILAARAERDNPEKLKRKAEIRLAGLAARDGMKRSEEQKNLAYALQVHEQTGKPLAQVFASCGVDVSKFMR